MRSYVTSKRIRVVPKRDGGNCGVVASARVYCKDGYTARSREECNNTGFDKVLRICAAVACVVGSVLLT